MEKKNIIQFPGLPSKLRETVFLGRKTTLRKLPLSELQSPQKIFKLGNTNEIISVAVLKLIFKTSYMEFMFQIFHALVPGRRLIGSNNKLTQWTIFFLFTSYIRPSQTSAADQRAPWGKGGQIVAVGADWPQFPLNILWLKHFALKDILHLCTNENIQNVPQTQVQNVQNH